jgi:heme oxygenase
MPPRRAISSEVRTRMRTATAALHLDIEHELNLLDPQLSIRRYQRILEILHGFYLPLENALHAFADERPLHGVALRNRTALLRRDLLSLGMTAMEVARLPRCKDLPDVRNLENWAGTVYVLEGADLGGRVIAPVICERFKLDKEKGVAFFSGEERDANVRWKSFLGWLEALAVSGGRADAMIASACSTFRSLVNWARVQEIPNE